MVPAQRERFGMPRSIRQRPMIGRRSLLQLLGVILVGAARLTGESRAQPTVSPVTLLSAPLELTGDWGGSRPETPPPSSRECGKSH